MLPFPSPLEYGQLQRRYNRFLADIVLDSGASITAHCPNSGSMLTLNHQGMRVAVSHQTSKTRKYPYTLEAVEENGVWVGINTARPNPLTALMLATKALPFAAEYDTFRTEMKIGDSRIDFLLMGENVCWLEVKNAQLRRRDTVLEFPDSVTARGTKHLHTLMERKQQGERAVLLFVGQRPDCTSFEVATDIDPVYAAAFCAAQAAGVETYCISCQITPQGTVWENLLPVC